MKHYVSIFISLILFQKIMAQIKIIAPKELRDLYNKTEIRAGFSNFGSFPYGQKLTGRLHLNENDNPISSSNDNYGEKDIESQFYLIESNESDNKNLNWMKQAERIELKGGQLVLIALNETIIEIERYFINKKDYQINPFLSSPNRINIPSMVINKKDADILKNYTNIILEVNIAFKGRNNVVILDLFLSSNNIDLYLKLSRIKQFLLEIKKNIKFIPHFVTYSKIRNNSTLSEEYIDNCLANGRYCIDSPSNAKEILVENIRQLCVYEYSKNVQEIDFFYKFTESYFRNCFDKTNKISIAKENCSNKVINIIGINKTFIDSCVEINSSNDNTNSFLEKDSRSQRVYHQLMQSRVAINGKFLPQKLRPFQILNSICSGLMAPPSMCYREGFSKWLVRPRRMKISALIIFFIISITFVVVNIIIITCCIIRINRNVANRIQPPNASRPQAVEVVTRSIPIKEVNLPLITITNGTENNNSISS